MPQQAHIAYRVDANTLLNTPELVLQRMSFKIMEKREQLLENLVNTKVQFKTPGGIDQGTCQSVGKIHCHVKCGSDVVKVPLKALLL